MKQIYIGVIISLLLIILGFIFGRVSVSNKSTEEIRYIELPPKTDSIPYPVPYEVIKYLPTDPEIIYRDSLIYPEVDTLAILEDWLIARKYSEVLFDDEESGKLEVSAEVQFNKMSYLTYQYDPIQKTVTHTELTTKLFQPFIMAGFNTGNFGNIQGGVFINNLGISYDLTMRFSETSNEMYHGIKIGYKF